MSNELTAVTGFTVNRVTKSGKVQTRSVLGTLMSGNRAERDSMVQRMVSTLIPNSSYTMVLGEMLRVFPASSLCAKVKKGERAAVGSIVDVAGSLFLVADEKTLTEVDVARCDRATMKFVAEAVVAKCEGKELKGEKAEMLNIARFALSTIKQQEAEKAAAEAALAESHSDFVAALAVSGTNSDV